MTEPRKHPCTPVYLWGPGVSFPTNNRSFADLVRLDLERDDSEHSDCSGTAYLSRWLT